MKVKGNFGITDFFDIKKGAKQGDKLSALLYCCVLAWVIKKTEEEVSSGYRIGIKF